MWLLIFFPLLFKNVLEAYQLDVDLQHMIQQAVFDVELVGVEKGARLLVAGGNEVIYTVLF